MRKARVFAAALVAVCAMSAVVASAAMAVSYNSEASPTTLSGTGLNTQVFTTKFGEVECTTASFSGEQVGTAVSMITAHPVYTNCEALGFNATVTTTGCDYTFTTPTATTGGGHALVDVVCSGTNKIHIVAAGGFCSVDVPAQENVGLTDFTNGGSGSGRFVTVKSTANAISYTGVGGLCSGAGTGGTYSGEVKVTGGGHGIWVE